MSLKLTSAATFAATAHVRLPTDTPDVYNEGSFVCRFNHLPHAEVNAFLDGLRELGDGETPARLQDSLAYQRDFVERALAGVEGISLDGAKPGADEALALVLGHQTLWLAALKAFLESHSGAAAKNSKPSRAR